MTARLIDLPHFGQMSSTMKFKAMCVPFRSMRTEDTQRGPVKIVMVRGRTDALRWRLNPNRILQPYRAICRERSGQICTARTDMHSLEWVRPLDWPEAALIPKIRL